MRSGVIWILGRPASGKSTLANQILDLLVASGRAAALVDSDDVRRAITPRPDYTDAERGLVYRAIAYVAQRLAQQGLVAVVAATAHRRRYRADARAICDPIAFIYARCSATRCEARDPKGLYAAAAADPSSSTLPGVGEPFEEPLDVRLIVDTESPVARGQLLELLRRIDWLGYT